MKDEVVDHDSDVRLMAAEDHWRLTLDMSGGIDSRDQTLSASFLVARRSVDLTRQKQAVETFGLKSSVQFRGLDKVVFDSVSRPDHLSRFESRQGANQALLDLRRKAHRKPVQIDLISRETFGLQEQLVTLAIGKTHHLVFERRTIARTNSGNLPVVQRRFVDMLPHEVVDGHGRIERVTRNLRRAERRRHERKGDRVHIAVLFDEP